VTDSAAGGQWNSGIPEFLICRFPNGDGVCVPVYSKTAIGARYASNPMKHQGLGRLFGGLIASLAMLNPIQGGSRTDDSVTRLLTEARRRLVDEIESRQSQLRRHHGINLGLEIYSHRLRQIAKKRVEITIGRWIAILRFKQARAAFRATGQVEDEEQGRMLRSAAENLRRAVRHSAQVYRTPELHWVVTKPSLANHPMADCIRCYVITVAVIVRDSRLINELDEMFITQVKMIRDIEAYDRWQAGVRRDCAALKTAISIVDLIRDFRNSRPAR
jgi:hypothetical protein